MSDSGTSYIGRSLLRREDQRLLTGQGQFVADLVLPGMLHAVFVRSRVAHGESWREGPLSGVTYRSTLEGGPFTCTVTVTLCGESIALGSVSVRDSV